MITFSLELLIIGTKARCSSFACPRAARASQSKNQLRAERVGARPEKNNIKRSPKKNCAKKSRNPLHKEKILIKSRKNRAREQIFAQCVCDRPKPDFYTPNC